MESKKEKKKISLPVLIIDIIVTVIFVAVFACMLTVMIQSVTGKEPTLFGFRSYVVITESMTGTYDKGDVIIVRVLDPEDLASDPSQIKEGDVVTFIAPEGFGGVDGYTVTHRVVEAPYEDEDGRRYIGTKGDAADRADEVPVPLENVTGMVLGKSELLAGLQNILRSKTGFLLLIIVPLVLIGLWQIALLAIAGAKNKKKAEETEGGAAAGNAETEQERIERLKKEAVEEYVRNRESEENRERGDKDGPDADGDN